MQQMQCSEADFLIISLQKQLYSKHEYSQDMGSMDNANLMCNAQRMKLLLASSEVTTFEFSVIRVKNLRFGEMPWNDDVAYVNVKH